METITNNENKQHIFNPKMLEKLYNNALLEIKELRYNERQSKERIHRYKTQVGDLKNKLIKAHETIERLREELEEYKQVVWEQNKKALNVTK